MPRDFLPYRERELLTWSGTFSNLISAAPSAYALTEAQAAAYTAAQQGYAAAYALTQQNQTRTPTNIITKNQVKETLIEQSRMLAGIIRANPSVTDAMKLALWLKVRKAGRTPIGAPGVSPSLSATLEKCRVVRIELTGTGPEQGRPEGVSGATVFTHVGAQPPTDVKEWQFATHTGKTSVTLSFPTITAATTVWVTASWFSPRKESGPASQPVRVNLPEASAVPTAAALKLAA